MSAEIEDLKQRVDRLERYLDTLEYRPGVNEAVLEIAPTRGARAEAAGGQEGEVLSQDPALRRLESMLRSVLLNQNGQSMDLRKAVR